jgi:uncharacterized paraquat-inducible protein A
MQQATPSPTRITIHCPQCNATLRASRELLGKVCPCPRCRYRVRVQVSIPSDADIALADDTVDDMQSLR